MSFHPLGLSDELLSAVADSGYTEPTDIQRQAIPLVLMGKDVVGVAQTGTGKTASFVLPLIDILAQGRSRARMPRSLIIAPTRELADQVAQNFEKYGRNHKLTMALLIGGVGFGDQDKLLEKGVDVLIATPGRLLDQFERGKILLSGVDILVIDEADRMLDMGFIPDVERICSLLGRNRQTLLFSATMPPPIKKLADKFMSSPKQVESARQSSTNENIEQRLLEVNPRSKRATLRKLLRQDEVTSSIVFSNRKRDVREIAAMLEKEGFAVGQIHGDMDQKDRLATMERFKAGDVNILVASDVAARGLDVKGVSHVINYDVPYNAEDYVHRIGRTGRAGAKGVSYTLATEKDAEFIAAIEKLIGRKIQTTTPGEEVEAAKGAAPRGAAPKSEADGSAEDSDSETKAKPKRRRSKSGGQRSRAKQRDAGESPDVADEPTSDSVEPAEESDRPAPEKKPRRRKSRAKTSPAKTTEGPDSRDGEASPKAKPAAIIDEPLSPEDAVEDWNGPIPAFLSR
ncbi:DEAD/DEAH box helicase [Pacificimonas flava]|uniref:DEAD-box ATP-dependent RNA helicase RhpA n=2 Tax=Pacificimonas TaxID=1960290 RepID=A0A219B4J6_9SPHN|nr:MULTISPECIES: DEAD/DEAH box helicase [Pacificimonas]MBZ6377184.1 DEAD/DEAH box helicase [Pacificimonas aurantium]OWV33094.1 DEAD/DEAH box helicase [Pacificimonas flava]